MLSDLRQTVRSLSQARAFSLAVILTLGLGVGLNAAVFSAIHGVLLRPLAFPAPDRLYTIWQDMTARGATRQEYGGKSVFTDWRARNHSFAAMAAFFRQPMDLSSIDPPDSVVGAMVSSEYFSVLGIRPLLGRCFVKEEETQGKNTVVVLSHELWVRRFGGDPAIVGKTIRANYAPYTVVGILPPGFSAPLMPDVEIYWPLQLDPVFNDRPYSTAGVIGRLVDGISPAAAAADMRRVAGPAGEPDRSGSDAAQRIGTSPAPPRRSHRAPGAGRGGLRVGASAHGTTPRWLAGGGAPELEGRAVAGPRAPTLQWEPEQGRLKVRPNSGYLFLSTQSPCRFIPDRSIKT